ncbi:unnamed protein product [Acanthoscelides obtectus]|uniref:Uncharacterized protein n=1 Tax=Acanthoscelides obtectus TaxID=200917 RepID=A0A9P0Q608_ACAOB|nr:unnamed protein product [Acanthoscelides obtectus]CAK1629289.1 hypothetical protein AOBTE_LOCUS5658 [Acanthoscelides obtectus]
MGFGANTFGFIYYVNCISHIDNTASCLANGFISEMFFYFFHAFNERFSVLKHYIYCSNIKIPRSCCSLGNFFPHNSVQYLYALRRIIKKSRNIFQIAKEHPNLSIFGSSLGHNQV